MEDQPLLHTDPCFSNCVAECGTVNSDIETIQSTPVMSKTRILWNFVVVNCSCFLFCTGIGALSYLQSTMNAADGLGPDSQAVIFGCSMISCILLPDVVIEKFGCKKVLLFTTIFQLPYVASNMYLQRDLFMITSALFGLLNGPQNSAGTVYLHELAVRYQRFTNQNIEYVVALCFGIFLFFSEVSLIAGNVISFVVLQVRNESEYVINKIPCGIHFLNNETVNGSYLEPPTEQQRVTLISIYLVLGVVSIVLMWLLLDPLENDVHPSTGWECYCTRFLAPIKQALKFDQILLIPISMVLGMENTLYLNEFTEAYIACSWGVHHVGFVTICFGVCGALMSLLVGPLVKCVSQMAVLILAALANISICVLLFLWDPSPETTSIYFIIAGVWGMGDAIWWSQITALYGLMFPNNREAAFSNLYFWSFLGFFLSYAYANYLSVAVKINILIAFLLAGMLGYLVGQIKIKCTARKEYVVIEDGH